MTLGGPVVLLCPDLKCLEDDSQLRGLADVQLDLILLNSLPDGQHFKPRLLGEALHCFCAFGRVDPANALLARGADPDFRHKGKTPLDVAFQRRWWDVAQVLIDGGATKIGKVELGKYIDQVPKAGGNTLLYQAAQEGDVQMSRLLLMAGADKEKASGVDYDTPLGVACSKGHLQTAQLLLAAGANKDKPVGSEPLQRACRNGHAAIVSLLLSAGADKDQVFRPHLCTPLSCACEGGHVEVVNLLLYSGASPDKVCNSREPGALYVAAESGHADIVGLLLRAGANRQQACGFDYDMPLKAASRLGHRDVVELLKAARAESRT
ncbi:ANK2 [Symbiodinium natans]|uniref:ANK2 protein n=1 Tax=Symbiodinium natans TaxID=878477 RepID=A0A812M975_9DINO|nr:ANK2 [Symbiodinium natans]